MTSKGTVKPFVKFIGNSSTDVTGSCHLVRYKKYCMLLDCGMIQGFDVATNYKMNLAMLKKIHVKDIDYIVLSHCHQDHSGLIPALYAKGCNAHLYVPNGSTQFLKLLWEDSMKIMQQDCQKLNNGGVKAAPFYTQEAIERALDRIIELPYEIPIPYQINEEITLTYYPANHIIHACQVYLDFKDGTVHHRLGYTGDIGGYWKQPFTMYRKTLPYVNLLIGENTYNKEARTNKPYDRDKDIEKIVSVVQDSHRVLIPCFSLQRTQILLRVLYTLWLDNVLPSNISVVLDSPLATRFCKIWTWDCDVMRWDRLEVINEWAESKALMESNQHCIVLSASGFLVGGRIMEWLKCSLDNPCNTILFCGYSGDNNLASQIRYGDKRLTIDGVEVDNQANIVELTSFSSHASYEELVEYYVKQCRFDKLALVHGDMKYKPAFANKLQDMLVEQGKSSRVICVNADTKIYF